MKRPVKRQWIFWKTVLADNDPVIAENKASHKLVGSFVGRMQKSAVFRRKEKSATSVFASGCGFGLVDDQGLEPWTPCRSGNHFISSDNLLFFVKSSDIRDHRL
jgi:hypothetical protein